jgi:flagellar hook-associated protein 2
MSSTSIASALALIANPQTFTGVSKYSSDMQSILTRTQQIAQVPVTALQNDQAMLKSEVTALTSLQSAVGTLSSTISFLGSLSAAGALTASSDNTDAVSAAISGSGATAGTYTIGNVTSLASVSMATMTDGVADPAATTVAPTDTNTLYLSAGGAQTTIALTANTNNLNGLRDAINSSGAGVSASILATSPGSYLTLTATVAGASSITLKAAPDGSGADLMSMNSTGSLAQFEVNGKAATSTSNQVTGVIPGVSLTLKATTATGEKATVSVSGNASAVANALQNIATAYNSLASSISTLTAPGSGVLAGSQVVRSIRNLMRDFAFYPGTGSINSLVDLGVSLDKAGTMSVDTSVLSSFTPGQLASALNFIGDGTNGLSAFSSRLDAYSDTNSGIIQQSVTQDQASEQRLQDQIDAMNVRIQVAQQTELAKLQAADSMLAQLTSQQSILTSSIQSLNYTLYGVQTSSTSSGSSS